MTQLANEGQRQPAGAQAETNVVAGAGAGYAPTFIILVVLLLFLALSFSIPTTDAGLQEPSRILASELSSLQTCNLKMRNATVAAARKLSGIFLEMSEDAIEVSDNFIHRLELTSHVFTLQLKDEFLEFPSKVQVALDQVAATMDAFVREIGFAYFIARPELPIRESSSGLVYKLRDISLEHSDVLGNFLAGLPYRVQRQINDHQLFLDLMVTLLCCLLIYTQSTEKHRRFSVLLSALPVGAFVMLQLLQSSTRKVSFHSISPPATAAFICLAGCAATIISLLRSRNWYFIGILVMLVSIETQVFIYLPSHFCSLRVAVGAPCAREMPCPIIAVPLATYDVSSEQLSLSEEAVYRLPKIKGPLYVLSEIGGFNTGKSARLTVSCRLLLPKALRDKCNSGFIVRNADVDPSLMHTGKTRGIWMVAVRLSDVKVDEIASDTLRKAVQRLDPTGTIIFLDSEGGEEMGKDAATINLMQLLVIQLSSHVNVAVKDSFNLKTLSQLSTLAHLVKLYSVFEQGRQSCQLAKRSSDIAESYPEFAIISMKGSDLLTFFPDIKSEDGHVIKVPKGFSLDAKHVLQEELQKALNQPQTVADATLVMRYMSALAYWGTLPATRNEMNFFKSMEDTPGLPPMAEDGFVLGWSVFNLPAILNRVKPKTMKNKRVDGNEALRFIRQFIQITRSINMDWLRSEGTKDLSSAICQHVKAKVKVMLDNVEEWFVEKLPIETSPVCINPEDKCPDDEFDRAWSHISQNITETTCFLKNLMTEDGWSDCIKEIAPEVSNIRHKMLVKNRELCAYNWSTGDWSSTCEGTCPGYRSRGHMCLNKRYLQRPNQCCAGNHQPTSIQSCDIWSYKWSPDAWTECSAANCGTQSRIVSCLRCDGEIASDGLCLVNAEKPHTSQQCNVHFAFELGDWSPCHCGSHQIRDVWCKSSCRERVEMSLCRDKAPADRHYCGDCPSQPHEGSCFGLQNFIRKTNGATQSLTNLRSGSSILSVSFADSSGPTVASDEVIFLMVAQTSQSNFVTIHTAMNATITLTNDHLLPVKCGSEAAAIETRPAIEIQPDRHWLLSHDAQGRLRWSPVSHVRTGVTDVPVVLLTMHDYAVVSNVVASCHTGSELVGKAIALPLKVTYKLLGPNAMESGFVRGAVRMYDQLIGY